MTKQSWRDVNNRAKRKTERFGSGDALLPDANATFR